MVLPYDNMDYGVDEVGARNITELQDVELSNLANGEVLQYNSSSEKWENSVVSSGAGTLDGLTDTNLTSLQNEQYLRYNSSSGNWENFTLTITDTDNLVDLTDTNISSVANTEVLKYNSTSGNWENAPVLINEIGDINITSLQNGEVLKYNSSSGKWENQDNTDTLNELTDVTLTGSSNNQVLKYNGSIWVNNFVNLTELGDTNISTLNNGDILRYNSTSEKWETDTFNIDDLDNVNITSLANNEVLKYNSSSGNWENSNRIDTLDELGDVTLTGVTSNDLLRYDGSNFVNTKIAFDNNFTNVNFTSLTNGDLIKYDGSNFVNFAPTYLDGAGITDNFLIKVVSGATTQTSFVESSVANTSTSLKTYIPGGILSTLAGSIETEFFGESKRRMHLTTDGIAGSNGITITSDGRVGIGVVDPEEDLELDGNIQLDTGGVQRSKIVFYDKQNDHEHAEIDGLGEGTNGGTLAFYTKVDGGSVTEKIRINNDGAIGIGGANYGTTGQVLTSNGSGNPVSWTANGTAPSTDIIPTADNTLDLGSASYRFNTAYCSKIDELNEIDTDSNDKLKITGSDGTHLTILLDSGYVYFGVDMGATADSSTVASSTTTGWAFRIESVTNTSSTVTGIDHYTKTYGWQNLNNIIWPGVGHFVTWSDDRLKHNEENISSALSTIMKLKPQLYDMTEEFYDADYQGDISGEYNHMAGFIAQEVRDIPELSFCCKGEEYDVSGNPTSLKLDYTSIFTHGISAIQELNTKINELETENATIKTALNSLLAMQGLSQI